MQVLMISDSDSKYGAPHSLKQMCETMKERYGDKLEITVVLAKSAENIKDELEGYGCKVQVLMFVPYYQGVPENKLKLVVKYFIRWLQYVYGNMMGVRWIRKHIDMQKIDIIHSNSSREDLGAMIAKHYGKPLIWHIREFGDKDYKCYSFRKNYIKLMNETAVKLLAVSDAVRKHWISKGIHPDKIITVYNGVKEIPEDMVSQHRNIAQFIRIVMLGSLNETKGQLHLVRAVSLLSADEKGKIQVDIIGDGSKNYGRAVRQEIEKNNLQNIVRMRGYISDPARLLRDYDVGVICSRSEGFGRVTAEYMMAGLPVLASDTGANPELIRNGEDGYLYPYGDAKKLSMAIRKFMYDKPKLIEMGENARKRAVDNFSSKVNADNIMNIYESIAF